ncbi:MAG: peptidylprolyl isomerase [Clostridia bacterium]|nr:peptidylprolyl isomerase [Clostridia bacterium]
MKKIVLTVLTAMVSIAIILVGFFMIKGMTQKVKNPIATIQIEGYEKPIKIELDVQSAPNAVSNFIKLANQGFYNDYKMTISDGKLTCAEDKKAKMSNLQENPQKDYTYGIKGDFKVNDVDNLIRHEKGVITMERDDYSYFGYAKEGYNSANSKFSILTKDNSNLNGLYAAFGKIIEGMDVLEAIAATRVDTTSGDTTEKNANTIKIKSITVDTFGADYGIPDVVNNDETTNKVNQIYQQHFGGSN